MIAVVAAAGFTANDSKLPTKAELIVAETLPASAYTSSPGAATLTVPELAPAAMPMTAPLDNVTVMVGCATLVRRAVETIVAPSATLAVAVRETLVVSIVSAMTVMAAAGFTVSDSKLPPAAELIVTETLPASAYTSSPGAATLTVPELAPAAMPTTAPLDKVTVTGVCATLVRLAV